MGSDHPAKGNFLSFLRVGVNKARHSLGIAQKRSLLRHPTFQRIFGRIEQTRGAGPPLIAA